MKIVLPFLLALHAMAVDAQFSLLDVVKQTQDLSKLYSIVNASTNLNSLFTAANQYTLFAPSNQALANFLNATSTKQTQADDLEAAIEYSLAHGFFPSTDITTVPQYVATFLTNITYSNVTDGQRMIMSKNSAGIIQIESGGKTTSLVKTPNTIAIGGLLHIVDTVLSVPVDLATQAVASGFNFFIRMLTLGASLSKDNFAYSQGILTMSNLTIFMPNSQAALDDFIAKTANASSQRQQDIFNYHISNGTIHYASDLVTSTKLKTLQGNNITIFVAPNGTKYANGVQILFTDYLVVPGVVHVIDGLLDFMNPTVPVFPTVTNTNSTATATPSASATTEPTSSNELSTGAKAGIAVGAVTGVALLGLGFFLFQRRKQKQKLAAELDGFQTAHELAGTSNVWELPHKPDVTAELSSPHGIQEMHNDERELTDHIPSSPQELHGDDPVLPGPPRSPVGMDYINPADIENMHSSWSARLDK